jgi:ribosome-binding factor A
MTEIKPHRNERIAEVILRTVGLVLKEEIENDGALVTIKEVIISPNHQHAKLLVSVFPQENQEEVLLQLKEKIGTIQQALNRKLRMRPVPKISFEPDESEEKAQQIMDILDEVEK